MESDGVLYDSRGFVCPPSMPFAQVELLPPTWFHRPGTYTMRVFEPGFSFTRDAVFQSYGENALLVSLDERPTCSAAECFQTVSVLSAGFVSQLEPVLTGDTEWVLDLTITPIEFKGLSATQIDFTVETCDSAGGLPCSVPIQGLSSWVYLEETQNRLMIIDVPGGPVGYDIGAHPSSFDQYWTEVAEPILASIEFADG
jgi:hypothetical protein